MKCSACGFEYQGALMCPRCIADLSTFSIVEEREPIILLPLGIEQVLPDGTTLDHAVFVSGSKVICYTHGSGCLFADLRLQELRLTTYPLGVDGWRR